MRALTFLLCLHCVTPLYADVYRWTDAAGQVHFGERPPPEGAERVELPKPAGSVPRDREAGERRERQQRMLDSYAHEREQKAAAAAEAAKTREQVERDCRDLQRYWRELNHGGPIYYKGDDDSRDYLDEQRRSAEKARVRATHLKHCGGEP